MSLELIVVKNANVPSEEYVLLQANVKMNIKGYALVDRTFNEYEEVSNEFRHVFFFPDLDIDKDDFVKLFTGEDSYKCYENERGTYTHELFWQSKECVWNDNGNDRASLISYTALKTVNVPAIKKE